MQREARLAQAGEETIELIGDRAWRDFLTHNGDGLNFEGLTAMEARAAALSEHGLVLGGGAAPLVTVFLRDPSELAA